APGVPDGATTVRAAAGEGQVVHGNGDAAGDLQDAAGVVAADRQPVSTWAVDEQVVRDAQLPAAQDNGAAQAVGEDDDVGAGVAIGVEARLAQRAGAAIGQAQDRERARNGPVLQFLQPGHEAPSLAPLRVSAPIALGAAGS